MTNSKRCEGKLCGMFKENFPALPGGTEERFIQNENFPNPGFEMNTLIIQTRSLNE
jgi:hypothetical protein